MSFREIVAEHWVKDAPDWLWVLADEADRTSQSAAARRIGYTTSALSSLFRARYGAGTAAIEEKVRGVLMKATITCPAMGEIGTHDCATWRKKARDIIPSSSSRIMMAKACRACAIFKEEEARRQDGPRGSGGDGDAR